MKISTLKRFDKNDLKGGELPGWIDPFLGVLNNFMDIIVTALSGRITFRDNMLGTVVENLEFTSGTAKVVNPQPTQAGRFFVTGVLLMDAGGKTVTGFGWSRRTDGNITVTATFSGGGSAKCRLHIHLE